MTLNYPNKKSYSDWLKNLKILKIKLTHKILRKNKKIIKLKIIKLTLQNLIIK